MAPRLEKPGDALLSFRIVALTPTRFVEAFLDVD
jgi:hypothetical protein